MPKPRALRASIPVFAAVVLGAVCVIPVQAAPVNGTTTGSSVSANVGDDKCTSTTIDVTYFTTCYFITNGVTAGGFGAYNFVFAGQGVAAGIPNIDPSDFTVSQYKPWVGSNNSTTNNVTDPASRNINRSVTDQEAGGCNVVISYKPSAGTDPTTVNFTQAYILSANGGTFSTGTMDNGGQGGPFYNERGVSGTGTTASPPIPDPARLNLVTNNTTPAWLVDIPYTPEWGYSNQGDDTITTETDTFQTFITGTKVISGTTYNVLYGGIQWGYTFSTEELPEPGALALVGGMTAFGVIRRRR